MDFCECDSIVTDTSHDWMVRKVLWPCGLVIRAPLRHLTYRSGSFLGGRDADSGSLTPPRLVIP